MTTTVSTADLKRRMHGAVEVLKHDLGGLRTGRASTALLDPVHVERREHGARDLRRHQRPGGRREHRNHLGQHHRGRLGDRDDQRHIDDLGRVHRRDHRSLDRRLT